MKLEEWMGNWGPALPIFLVFALILWKLVFKVLPAGFRDVRRTLVRAANGNKRRHAEHIEKMESLLRQMKKVKKRCGQCGRKQGAKKTTPTKR